MTKNEYLITLAARLQALAHKPAQIYPELKHMIEFYQEMIDDKIEDGMTEEEAVAAMETPDEIADRLARELGEETGEGVELADEPAPVYAGSAMRREYDPAKITLVRVKDSDHNVRLVRGERVALNYEDDPNGKYEISHENGIIALEYISERRSFFRFLLNWKRSGKIVTVELPQSWNGAADIHTSNGWIFASAAIDQLAVHTSNGSITFEDITVRNLCGSTSNGAIRLEDANCGNVDLGTSNGRIVANGICCETARLTSSNASVNVYDATVRDLLLKSSNGGMRVQEFTGEKINVQTSNASIKVDELSASDITLVTSNGSITGSVVGKMGDFAITSKNANGSNNLPNGTSGAGKLDVRTINGRIAVEFVEKADAKE